MTEYWKSLPRKFCVYCKCWITDNKSSVEFHERGKNHQENVKKKLDELRKKGVKDAKEKDSTDSVLKAIEEAALKSAKEDLKRDPSLASLYGAAAVARASDAAPAAAAAAALPASAARAKPRATQAAASKGGCDKLQALALVSDGEFRGSSGKGDPASCDEVAAVPEPSDVCEAGGNVDSSQSDSAQTDGTECEWQKALSPEGYEYYWNVRTGESSWTLPNDGATVAAAAVTGASETEAVVETGTGDTAAEFVPVSVTDSVRRTEAASNQPSSSDAVVVSSVASTLTAAVDKSPSSVPSVCNESVVGTGPTRTGNVADNGTSVKSECGSNDPACGALSTVKAEIATADPVKAESHRAISSARAAIAAASARLKAAAAVKLEDGVKTEACALASDMAAAHVKVEPASESEQCTAGGAASAKDAIEQVDQKDKTIQKRPKPAITFSPYGRWVSVESEKPPIVDLELPTDATKYSVSAADIPLPEPAPVKSAPVQFKEKVVTLQGRHSGGGEVAFKKRKIGGAKSNSRRRDDEDE